MADLFHDEVNTHHHDEANVVVRHLAGKAELRKGVLAEGQAHTGCAAEKLRVDDELTDGLGKRDGYQREVGAAQDQAGKEDDTGHNAHNEHIQHSGHPGVHAGLCDHQTAHIGTQTHVSGQTQRVLAGDAAQNVPRHGQGRHIEGENENVDDVRFIHDQRDRCEDGDDDSQNDRQIAVIGFNCFSGIHLIASSES